MGIKDSFLFSSLIHHHALDWCSTDPSFNATNTSWIVAAVDGSNVVMVEVKLMVTEQGLAYTYSTASR